MICGDRSPDTQRDASSAVDAAREAGVSHVLLARPRKGRRQTADPKPDGYLTAKIDAVAALSDLLTRLGAMTRLATHHEPRHRQLRRRAPARRRRSEARGPARFASRRRRARRIGAPPRTATPRSAGLGHPRGHRRQTGLHRAPTATPPSPPGYPLDTFPGAAAVRPRAVPDDVRQPAVDHPAVRRVLHRRGVERVLPPQPGRRAEGPLGRLRPGHPPRLRLRPPAGGG